MAITERTRKLLWGPSGNLCAFCRRELKIDATNEDDESIVGDECHIISGQTNGPRYDPNFPAHLIDEIDNLMLLCRVHHKMVDGQPLTYTVEALHQMKARHEAWHRSVVASAVVVSLEDYEGRSAITERKTFVSREIFFLAKTPRTPRALFDFSRTLLGREPQVEFLNAFFRSTEKLICLFAGRGGNGKSKLLHDWTACLANLEIVFLKDVPQWYAESYKEIPLGPVLIVVDDAHRADSIPEVLQLLASLRPYQNIKLVLATRPGSIPELEQLIYRAFSSDEVARMNDLEALTSEEAESLAKEVLGDAHNAFAKDLAAVSDNNPLVIVAGGNLIASHHINPAEITNLEDFRQTVFSRFYDELKLSGPEFAINPPRRLLQIIAAIGPVNAEAEHFLTSVEAFLNCNRNDILTTLDLLATYGVVTPRSEPVRIVPDVLSDYVLESACVGPSKTNTRYVDAVFAAFGDQFFGRLMQNLSELDWRLDRAGYGLDLLDSVWQKIFSEFQSAEMHLRRHVIDELAPAAGYQPNKILELVHLARVAPVVEGDLVRSLRVGRDYLLKGLPTLLGATAYHPDYRSQSVDVLWELATHEQDDNRLDTSAKHTLERLASYQLYKWPAFNFAMLLQCVRLCKRDDAFDRSFTPLDILDEILEHEGEFTESRGNSVAFGAFGLNYTAVAPVRENALQFLESLLYSECCAVAVRAIRSLQRLLYRFLNRMGRESTPEELIWHDAERQRVLDIFERRLTEQPLSLPIQRNIIHAFLSTIAVNCGEDVRERSQRNLDQVTWSIQLTIFDAICSRDGDFPIMSTEDPAGSWTQQSNAQLLRVNSALMENFATVEQRAANLIANVKQAFACKLEPHGFERILSFCAQDGALASALVDCILADERPENMLQQLGNALFTLHATRPEEFRLRAYRMLESGAPYQVLAAASALRVHAESVVEDDISLIAAYLQFPNSGVKQCGLRAIAYLGKKAILQPALLRAVLNVKVEGEAQVAAALTDSFGPYGVWLDQLSERDVSGILEQLAPIEDLDTNQGRITTFLSKLVKAFPDQVLDFLMARVKVEQHRRAEGDWSYRSINFTYGHVSFGSVNPETKIRLIARSLEWYLRAESPASSYRELFWSVLGGLDEATLSVISDKVDESDQETLSKILKLIQFSPGRLAFGAPVFAATVLRKLSGENKKKAIEAFVGNAHHLGFGGAAGRPAQMMENHQRAIGDAISNLPMDDELAELQAALVQGQPTTEDFRSIFGLQVDEE
ncbi:hypothetical protein [Granulicella mallensis]|uniref:HNH endonuclease n=1 Tax=Granulicella mallensis (strain ATCC BAA-1857 / DSM 23137 / MP5ACTX8) TaxID=682795 RepID=G8NT37_GRAMM|nr:hypothetical protein [Granulicella mallensis]AEU37467.1 hypothetical protein AciX8_3166 [Granulicella mallensis MP5ACTX8]